MKITWAPQPNGYTFYADKDLGGVVYKVDGGWMACPLRGQESVQFNAKEEAMQHLFTMMVARALESS